MPVNKLKIFKIKISKGGNFSLDNSTQQVINDFLSEANMIYVGHSTSVLSEDVDSEGRIKRIDRFLVVTIVYKDLSETAYDLTKTSSKTKQIVTREIESGQVVKQPEVKTAFDSDFDAVTHTKTLDEVMANPRLSPTIGKQLPS